MQQTTILRMWTFGAGLALVLGACAVSTSAEVKSGDQPASDGRSPQPATPTPEGAPADGDANANPQTIAAGSPGAEKAGVGAACTAGTDCQSGVCEGLGCDAGAGRCVEKERVCTRDLKTYCGCDGQEFRSSGSCPGRTYRNEGACEGGGNANNQPVADGQPCSQASDCASGICEGEGCGDNAGTCQPKARACTRDLQEYCGCDDKVFRASGSCPGRLYKRKGAC